jgi:predicted RND superfamily exporter protein
MGIIFIVFIALIIFEIYIRRDKFSNEKDQESIFTKNQLILLILIVIILPILVIVALQTGLLGYNSENIREEYKTDTYLNDQGIF